MTKYAGSTVAAIRIDYAPDTLEELTAPVQRWQHQLKDNATARPTGGDPARVLATLEHRARFGADPDSGDSRRPAAA